MIGLWVAIWSQSPDSVTLVVTFGKKKKKELYFSVGAAETLETQL